MTADDHSIPGYCPMGCGQTLFRASGGYVTCSYIGCANPSAVSDILEDRETEHLVDITDAGFIVRHPLRERMGDDIMTCRLTDYMHAQDGPPPKPGRYRVYQTGQYGESYAFETVRS